jgi:hypothetical protein
MGTNTRPSIRQTDATADATLRLMSVVAGSLPAELATGQVPERYTVGAVFSRKVSGTEARAIQSPDTRQLPAELGYGHIRLTVSDRWLEIANTNLEELNRRRLEQMAQQISFEQPAGEQTP